MPAKPPAGRITRRGLLSAAGLAGAGIALTQRALVAEAAKPDPAITEVQAWQRQGMGQVFFADDFVALQSEAHDALRAWSADKARRTGIPAKEYA